MTKPARSPFGWLSRGLAQRDQQKTVLQEIRSLDRKLEHLRLAAGRIEKRLSTLQPGFDPHDFEFQVYSQSGEDGWIQSLLARVPIGRRAVVEFGVQDYWESNSRFLIEDGYWQGLVIDASEHAIESIRTQDIYWRRQLTAVHAFITRENINTIISSAGFGGDIGLLSIDIDGNDYWIWDAIDVVQPRIVVCEYNALFGPVASVSVPYDPAFERMRAHYSGLYFGASLAALKHLANGRGYHLVGCNRFGSNAFFVRSDVAGDLLDLPSAQAYRAATFRQSRSRHGHLTYLDTPAAREQLREMPIADVGTGARIRVGDLDQ